MTAQQELPIIGFAGMTHLGLNSAVGMAEKGFNVVCFDPADPLIAQLNSGEMPVSEPQLSEIAKKNKDRITFTSSLDALNSCDVLMLAPGVPVTDDGVSDLEELDHLLELVIPRIRSDATVVNLSQVPPGFTRARQRPGLHLYYQVETLIFGERSNGPSIQSAISSAVWIPKHLPDAFRVCLEAYDCPILPMRYESAELCKISINCCLVASISVANTLAELCEGIGAD